MTGPQAGDGTLTSPEAILQACKDAVAAAVTVGEAQQAAAAAWMSASEPEAGGEPGGRQRRRAPLTPAAVSPWAYSNPRASPVAAGANRAGAVRAR